MINRSIGIFIPVYYREDKARASFKSLQETKILSNNYSLKVSVFIGINGCEKTYMDELANMKDTYKFPFFLHIFFKNIGKPAGINFMVDFAQKNMDLDFIVSYDSDMIVTDKLWLLKLVEIFEGYNKEEPIGCLCTNQTGNCCHVLDKDPIIRNWNGYTLRSRAGNEGVAGGCLFTSMETFNKMGKYAAFRVYAADDGHFMLSCSQKEHKCYVVDEISLEHPFETDPGYADWKAKATRGELNENESLGYYGEITE